MAIHEPKSSSLFTNIVLFEMDSITLSCIFYLFQASENNILSSLLRFIVPK